MKRTREELALAAKMLIAANGLGQYSRERRYRDRRPKAQLAAGACLVGPSISSVAHYVYVIGAEEGPLKVGLARDPHKRLAGIQTNHPEQLRIIAARQFPSHQAARSAEVAAHAALAESRVRGEWFSCSIEAATEVLRKL